MTKLLTKDGQLLPSRAVPASTGPWLDRFDTSDEYYGQLLEHELMAEERARAANGGKDPAFCTGTLDPRIPASMRVPVRNIDDPPDRHHSPDLAEDNVEYTVTERLADVYGLDEHGSAKPEHQITPEQARARARKYGNVDAHDHPRIQQAGD
jgi:hypothetical protein